MRRMCLRGVFWGCRWWGWWGLWFGMGVGREGERWEGYQVAESNFKYSMVESSIGDRRTRGAIGD